MIPASMPRRSRPRSAAATDLTRDLTTPRRRAAGFILHRQDFGAPQAPREILAPDALIAPIGTDRIESAVKLGDQIRLPFAHSNPDAVAEHDVGADEGE